MVFSFRDFLSLVYVNQAKNFDYVGRCSYKGSRSFAEVYDLVNDRTIFVDCSDSEMVSVLGPSMFGP